MTDLEVAFAALRDKQTAYNLLWDYYNGDHPLVYSAARLREVFRNMDARFVENWCAVVVDTPLERLALQRMTVAGDDEATTTLETLWTGLQLGLDADDVHLCALVTGEAFLFVWPDEQEQPTAYYNDSRLCHITYNAENPRVADYGAKWWQDDKTYHINLYYPDRIEYYATGKKSTLPESAAAFKPSEEPQDNPYGIIPLFHFRPERRAAISALDDVIPIQAAINKLLADMMVSAEFGAFRQRWVISNADLGTLRNAPNEIWMIPSGDGLSQGTAVGEFSETSLENYDKSIERRIAAISAITGIPSYYFFRQGGQPPSGEALVTMEAPLNKKVRRYIRRFTPIWQQAMAFMLRLQGLVVAPAAITPVYASPETVPPKMQAEIRHLDVGTGIPLVTELRREGWSEQELAQLQADQQMTAAEAQTSLAAALIAQQRQLDQG